jgi:uncharacterized membrane protein
MTSSHSFIQIGISYLASIVFMLAVDALWLTVLMGATYKSYLGPLMLDQPKLGAAAVFYVLFSVGLVVFGVMPGIAAQDWKRTAMLSALFGLIAYATYDLSNLATLKGWSLTLTVIDIAWGTVLAGSAGTVGYLAAKVWANHAGAGLAE